MIIKNFEYNGISGRALPGNAPYTVEFVEWTGDPGIFLGKCSDGKDRLIPAWAVVHDGEFPPMPDYTEVKEYLKETGALIHMGTPSSSI